MDTTHLQEGAQGVEETTHVQNSYEARTKMNEHLSKNRLEHEN